MPVSEIPVDLIASCFPGRDAEFIVTTRRGNVLVFDACSGNLTRHIGVSGKTIRCIHLPKIGLGMFAEDQLFVIVSFLAYLLARHRTVGGVRVI
jgi:hypothetical protein